MPRIRGLHSVRSDIADIASRTHCPGAVAGARGSETAARAPKLSLVSRLRHRRTLGDESTESSTGPIEPVTADSPAPHAPIRDTTRYKTHRRPRTVAYALLHAGFPHAAQSHPPNVHCRRPTGAGAEPKPLDKTPSPPWAAAAILISPPHSASCENVHHASLMASLCASSSPSSSSSSSSRTHHLASSSCLPCIPRLATCPNIPTRSLAAIVPCQ